MFFWGGGGLVHVGSGSCGVGCVGVVLMLVAGLLELWLTEMQVVLVLMLLC